jgi:drug/metabolite transporter (DMT)-like permease
VLTAALLTAIKLPLNLSPTQALGIPIALAGAVFLSVGAQFQHRGVTKIEAARADGGSGLGGKQVLALLHSKSWVAGILMLGLAVALQLTSLNFSPLIVVQPLGVIALVVTAILNSRVSGVHLSRYTIRAIAMCVIGVGIFVSVAAPTSNDSAPPDGSLITILIMLAVVLAIVAVIFLRFRPRVPPTGYILLAGFQGGFVATLAKTVILRIKAAAFDITQFNVLTVFCIVGLVVVALSATYTVQTAYSVGPPDLVIAGLTVIDPLVAVGIGIVVLHEAAGAPLWTVFVFLLAGAIAVYGVFSLSRHHPQLQRGVS